MASRTFKSIDSFRAVVHELRLIDVVIWWVSPFITLAYIRSAEMRLGYSSFSISADTSDILINYLNFPCS